jgi:hypothetical protein
MRALALSLALLAMSGEAHAVPELTSFYIPGADGTELAVDVWREPAATERVPAIVQLTRYWRGFRGGGPMDPRTVEALTAAGYAIVIVDVRGTGASFGARTTEFSDAEIADYGAMFDWITAQDWSNGRLATLGSSYLGNSAELSAITRHPALRAIVPRFSDFSEYRHAILPGGVRNSVIAVAWPNFVAALDRNDPCAAFANAPGPDCAPGAPWAGGVRPVHGREDDLVRAVAQHANNADIGRIAAGIVYSDDSFERDGARDVTLDAVSPIGRWRAIETARVPSYHWASWFDGGTAEGVLARYRRNRGPMRVVIGAWTHGGGQRADPFAASDTAPEPDPAGQLADIITFLDPLLKEGAARETANREVRYFTLGANQWRTTPVWPPRGISTERYYLGVDNTLTRAPGAGTDAYEIDFTATTGVLNRWHTQLGAAVDYGDRAEADAKLLVYTGAPLQAALEITGAPVARITLRSSQPDGALFVYLEAVLPNGRVIHLSDANRRLRFRDRDTRFTRREARPVRPGERFTVDLTLSPVSVELPAGARLRLAIGGADADTFERIPSNGETLRYQIDRGASFITLPSRAAM